MKTHTLIQLIAWAVASLGTLSAQTLFVPGGTVGTSSTGNVGIGTANPAAKLDVGGYIRAIDNGTNFYPTTGSGLELNASNGHAGILGYDRDAHAILPLWINGNALSLNAYTSAFVGVGTTTPTDRLTIQAAGTPSVAILNANWAIGDEAVLRFRHGDGTGDGAGNGAQSEMRSYLPGGGNSDLRFYTTNNLSLNSVPGLTLTGQNNVGIGTTAPSARLEVNGVAFANSEGGGFIADAGGYKRVGFMKYGGLEGALTHNCTTLLRFGQVNVADISTATQSNFTAQMIIDTGGNVGIGTTNPTEKLAVNGRIRAKEVIVETNWSDFVFDPGYRLAPLSEVERHIKAHGTLPGVPSEAEVAKEGVSVGDMQARLLQKIEELTLHAIEQEKRLNEQRAQIERQNQLIRRLVDDTHNRITE